MKAADKHNPRQDPDGRESPLAILLAILINAVALLIVIGPLIATHQGS